MAASAVPPAFFLLIFPHFFTQCRVGLDFFPLRLKTLIETREPEVVIVISWHRSGERRMTLKKTVEITKNKRKHWMQTFTLRLNGSFGHFLYCVNNIWKNSEHWNIYILQCQFHYLKRPLSAFIMLFSNSQGKTRCTVYTVINTAEGILWIFELASVFH